MSTAESSLDAMLVALGREIRAERVRRNLSRAELADLASRGREISEKQVGKIERGERGQLAEVWQIVDALGGTFSTMLRAAEESAQNEAS